MRKFSKILANETHKQKAQIKHQKDNTSQSNGIYLSDIRVVQHLQISITHININRMKEEIHIVILTEVDYVIIFNAPSK